jgi:hypothetical protein
LIHMAGLIRPTNYYPHERAITQCGREVNFDTWTRIRMYDQQMFGKGPRAIRAMIDSSVICDRCLPVTG